MFVLVRECSFNIFFEQTYLPQAGKKSNVIATLLYNNIGKLDCLFVKEIQILSCFMKNKKV